MNRNMIKMISVLSIQLNPSNLPRIQWFCQRNNGSLYKSNPQKGMTPQHRVIPKNKISWIRANQLLYKTDLRVRLPNFDLLLFLRVILKAIFLISFYVELNSQPILVYTCFCVSIILHNNKRNISMSINIWFEM